MSSQVKIPLSDSSLALSVGSCSTSLMGKTLHGVSTEQSAAVAFGSPKHQLTAGFAATQCAGINNDLNWQALQARLGYGYRSLSGLGFNFQASLGTGALSASLDQYQRRWNIENQNIQTYGLAAQVDLPKGLFVGVSLLAKLGAIPDDSPASYPAISAGVFVGIDLLRLLPTLSSFRRTGVTAWGEILKPQKPFVLAYASAGMNLNNPDLSIAGRVQSTSQLRFFYSVLPDPESGRWVGGGLNFALLKHQWGPESSLNQTEESASSSLKLELEEAYGTLQPTKVPLVIAGGRSYMCNNFSNETWWKGCEDHEHYFKLTWKPSLMHLHGVPNENYTFSAVMAQLSLPKAALSVGYAPNWENLRGSQSGHMVNADLAFKVGDALYLSARGLFGKEGPNFMGIGSIGALLCYPSSENCSTTDLEPRLIAMARFLAGGTVPLNPEGRRSHWEIVYAALRVKAFERANKHYLHVSGALEGLHDPQGQATGAERTFVGRLSVAGRYTRSLLGGAFFTQVGYSVEVDQKNEGRGQGTTIRHGPDAMVGVAF